MLFSPQQKYPNNLWMWRNILKITRPRKCKGFPGETIYVFLVAQYSRKCFSIQDKIENEIVSKPFPSILPSMEKSNDYFFFWLSEWKIAEEKNKQGEYELGFLAAYKCSIKMINYSSQRSIAQ